MRRSFMKCLLKCSLLSGAVFGALLTVQTSVYAQSGAGNFPNQPIRLIVPWPPGGSTDRHLRAFAEAASKQLGQQVVVVNTPGAGGTLGPAQMAASAKPDGYTLSQFPMGMIRLPHMQKANWDPLKDFSFIMGLSGYTFGLTVKSDSPHKSLKDYLEAAKKNPNKLNYSSTGNGTTPHLVVEELAMKAGVSLTHVPFKGNADSTVALLGGHVDMQSDATGWGPHVDSGKMRLFVTFGEKRTKRWPNVQTAKELGFDIVSNSPYGIAGPKGMDPAIVKILHDAFRKAMDDPDHLKVVDQLDQELWYKSSADYAQWVRDTNMKERALIERLGLLAK